MSGGWVNLLSDLTQIQLTMLSRAMDSMNGCILYPINENSLNGTNMYHIFVLSQAISRAGTKSTPFELSCLFVHSCLLLLM